LVKDEKYLFGEVSFDNIYQKVDTYLDDFEDINMRKFKASKDEAIDDGKDNFSERLNKRTYSPYGNSERLHPSSERFSGQVRRDARPSYLSPLKVPFEAATQRPSVRSFMPEDDEEFEEKVADPLPRFRPDYLRPRNPRNKSNINLNPSRLLNPPSIY